MKSVFVIGDSISCHWGDHLQHLVGNDFSYTRKTGEETAWKAVDTSGMGRNGGDSNLVLQYLEVMKDFLRADILLLNSGMHDIKRNESNVTHVPLVQYQANLKKIIEIAKDVASIVAWVTTTDFDEVRHNQGLTNTSIRFQRDGENYHLAVVDIMKELRVPIIDLREFTKNLPGELYKDHAHFVEGVQIKQAQFIMHELKNL